MKKFLFILTIFSSSFVFTQKPIFVTAKVNKVNLYLNSAELNHTFSAPLKKGTNEIVVKNVSNRLDENSIRLKASKAITIMSASFTNKYYKEYEINPNSVAFKRVQDSIELITKAMANTRNKIDMEKHTIQLLDRNQSVSGNNTGVSVAELTKLVNYYRQKRLSSSNSIYTLNKKLKKLEKTLSRLHNQLSFVKGHEEKLSNGKIVVQVMSNREQTAKFDLSYITNLAKWKPFYEIEAKDIDQPIHLITKGNVVQNTGIDWKQVKLTLSSTQPNSTNQIPYFSRWVLNLTQPYATRGARGDVETLAYNKAKSATLHEAKYDKKEIKQSNTTADYVNITEQNLSISFDVAIPYDIYSNGKSFAVALSEQKIPAKYSYYAAPKLNSDALLTASITNYAQYNLLAGEANVIFEGVYVGKTFLNPSSTKDTLMIALGVDKNVIIKRKKVVEKSGNKVFSGKRESAYVYDISIRNNKKSTISLVLKDQFPISKNKEVTVELTDTDKATINHEIGTLTWKLNIKPQKSKKLRFGYKVRYPKDKKIYNL